MSESVNWMDLVQNWYKWNSVANRWRIFAFHDTLSFYWRTYLVLPDTDIATHMGVSNYDAVNMLVAVSRPRLVPCLSWPYAASYNESPVFGEFRIYSATLFSLLHILVISSFLRWNILLSILFSDTYFMFFTYRDRPNCTRIKTSEIVIRKRIKVTESVHSQFIKVQSLDLFPPKFKVWLKFSRKWFSPVLPYYIIPIHSWATMDFWHLITQ